MPSSMPYRCLACMRPGACGYHGILVYEADRDRPGFEPPVCDHHKKPAKGVREKPAMCHPSPVTMVPVR